MLEMDVIQVRGFRNIVEGGKVTGFQFRVRSTYYRGMWAVFAKTGRTLFDVHVGHYWKPIFSLGFVLLSSGKRASCPRHRDAARQRA